MAGHHLTCHVTVQLHERRSRLAWTWNPMRCRSADEIGDCCIRDIVSSRDLHITRHAYSHTGHLWPGADTLLQPWRRKTSQCASTVRKEGNLRLSASFVDKRLLGDGGELPTIPHNTPGHRPLGAAHTYMVRGPTFPGLPRAPQLLPKRPTLGHLTEPASSSAPLAPFPGYRLWPVGRWKTHTGGGKFWLRH